MMKPPRSSALRSSSLCALVAALPTLVASCTPPVEPPPPCGGNAAPCVIAGHTSAAVCEAGSCLGLDVDCETDADCFFALAAGDELPTWDRPQGGLGTRLNVRFEGFPEGTGESDFTALRTVITDAFQLSDPNDPASKIACSPDLCADGLGCECDEGAGFRCTELADGAFCAELICKQTNRRFPLDPHPNETLVVAELPVRFENEYGLEELDGREVDLTLIGELSTGELVSQTVSVVLKVGEFVKPSWWEQ